MSTINEKTKQILYTIVCGILLFSITIQANPGFNRIDLNKDNLRISAEFDPSGLIALWSGPLNTIPEGWKLCNGGDSTLNISDRFVYSTGNMEEPGTMGGSSLHNHSYTTVPYHDHGVTDITQCAHSHTYNRPTGAEGFYTGGASCVGPYNSYTNTHYAPHSHGVEYTGETDCYTSEEENIIPPYYKLAYIEKETSDTIIPIGLIVMWAGSIENIPASWELCNGSNGTPDLRDNFIQGVTTGEDPGFSGGSLSHNHTYTDIPRHTHTLATSGYDHNHQYGINSYDISPYVGPGLLVYRTTSGYTYTASVPHIHNMDAVGIENCTTQNSEHIPPYYKIAFIMNTAPIDVLPLGTIVMWGDSIATMPSGWNQCNGSFGTPDMLNRFPRSIATGEQPGINGGSPTHRHIYTEVPLHTHTILSDSMVHNHIMFSPNGIMGAEPYGSSGTYYESGSTTSTTSSTSAPHSHNVNPTGSTTCYTEYESNIPPYIKLIYMQKSLSIYNPSPADGAIGISDNPTLSVETSDLEGDDLIITFYNASDDSVIDADNVLGGSGTASVVWSGLSVGTSYSWYITADDSSNNVQFNTWSFTTNHVPNEPINPSPINGAMNIEYNPTLSVEVYDDGDDLLVTFYDDFDDSIIDSDTVFGGSGTASVTWSGLSPGATYSWYATANDGLSTNQSSIWSFTTNHVPNEPINPFPNDGAIDAGYNPTLSVDVSDDDGDDLTITFYDASDHSVINTEIILAGSGTASVTWSGLSQGTTYSWYATADDGLSTNQSATWSFTTIHVPNEPTNPSPADGALDVSYNPILSVDVSDDDGDDLTITFYDASDDSIIDTYIILGGSGTAWVVWSGLSPGITYSWYATADDGLNITQSSTWIFTTAEEIKPPPGVPGFSLMIPVIVGTAALISVKVHLKRKKKIK
ncbi:MAG: hypothetical protein KGD65_03785 [Candidatus Lokiarchaeota archaeon]|nr:hypothetical protein [Candidatus Lokiarchaeota archaeon]